MLDTVVDARLEEDVIRLGALFVRLSWLGRRRMEQELDAFGLTVPQYMALRCTVEHDQGCSMSQLADSSEQVPATMTGVVDRLAERGLVRRERDAYDRRTQRVVITAEGRDLLTQIAERKRAWISRFAEQFNAEERQKMIALAERYLSALEKTMPVGTRSG